MICSFDSPFQLMIAQKIIYFLIKKIFIFRGYYYEFI